MLKCIGSIPYNTCERKVFSFGKNCTIQIHALSNKNLTGKEKSKKKTSLVKFNIINDITHILERFFTSPSVLRHTKQRTISRVAKYYMKKNIEFERYGNDVEKSKEDYFLQVCIFPTIGNGDFFI